MKTRSGEMRLACATHSGLEDLGGNLRPTFGMTPEPQAMLTDLSWLHSSVKLQFAIIGAPIGTGLTYANHVTCLVSSVVPKRAPPAQVLASGLERIKTLFTPWGQKF